MPGAPPEVETSESDSCLYVEVRARSRWTPERTPRALGQAPMDMLLAYHTRLAASAAQIPYSKALEWIQQRDEGERRLWADKHRTSSWSWGASSNMSSTPGR